jgi:small GTP-binding protein
MNNENLKLLEKDTTITIKSVLVGDCNAGKSCLINRYITNNFNPFESAPTIGSSFSHKSLYFDNHKFKFDIWDTAGSERYRSLVPMYYRKAELVFICVDLTSENTLKQIDYWINELNKYSHSINPIIVIIGTKSDLLDDNNNYNQVSKFINIKFKDYMFFETSSKNNINVSKTFNTSFELICKKKIQDLSSNNIIDSFEINDNLVYFNSNNYKECFPVNYCTIT